MMPKYWIGVASREHVKNAVESGIAQVCHGKGVPLKRMAPDDWIIYYSSVEFFRQKVPCRKFTAIGKIKNKEPYQCAMSETFVPWRRDVAYKDAFEVAIESLIHDLTFITNKVRWGFPFMRGCFEIPEKDFILIAKKMGITHDKKG